MTSAERPEPGTRGEAVVSEMAELRRELVRQLLFTDSVTEHLWHRITALEEIAATPWPRRLLSRARLGRRLRAAARHVQGATLAERLSEAAALELGQR